MPVCPIKSETLVSGMVNEETPDWLVDGMVGNAKPGVLRPMLEGIPDAWESMSDPIPIGTIVPGRYEDIASCPFIRYAPAVIIKSGALNSMTNKTLIALTLSPSIV